MYLKNIYIENVGPLRNLELQFPTEGNPKPIVLVGANGGGKTNLLSIIADAIFEAQAAHFTDVVANQNTLSRAWFRLIGPETIASGAGGGVSLLRFQHDGADFYFKEKSGRLPVGDVMGRLPEHFKAQASWADEGGVKQFSIADEQAQKIFAEGAYLFFPSSRAELPHWLNRGSLPSEDFDLSSHFAKRLNRPIYVEKGLDRLKQWLSSLLIDIRIDAQLVRMPKDDKLVPIPVGNWQGAFTHRVVWDALNQILRVILDDQSARFVWGGRHASSRLGFARDGVTGLLPLDALSAGQASLMSVFGTLLRYGDKPNGLVAPSQVSGICVVDEIDAHMHVNLQHQAIPHLVSMFPKVQFILSSHSPLFVLGMEGRFGQDGAVIIDMPSGSSIPAEAYAEFARALEVFKETRSFAEAMLAASSGNGGLLVLVEGETDPLYLNAAMEKLGRGPLKEAVEIAWVGAKDPNSGQGFHTGKDALNSTASVLKAKPSLVRRPVLLLYDGDANKADETFERLFIRSLPQNLENTLVDGGIENLLPPETISAVAKDVYEKKEKKRKDGGVTTTISLNKTKLCAHICGLEDASVFKAFAPVLDLIEKVALAGTHDTATQEPVQ